MLEFQRISSIICAVVPFLHSRKYKFCSFQIDQSNILVGDNSLNEKRRNSVGNLKTARIPLSDTSANIWQQYQSGAQLSTSISIDRMSLLSGTFSKADPLESGSDGDTTKHPTAITTTTTDISTKEKFPLTDRISDILHGLFTLFFKLFFFSFLKINSNF